MRDLRVIELAGSVAGAYCGRLFTVMGADVVLVEPADGTPLRRRGPLFTAADGSTRSALHEHLDAGKRSVTVDLDGPDGDATLAWADVVIVTVDGDPAVGHRACASACARSTLGRRSWPSAASASPGRTPGWRTSDLVDWASGGYLFLNGEPGRAPLQGGGPWASIIVGATAALGGAVAVLDATLTGEGQLVDIGAMEATAGGHQWALTQYTHTGVLKRRVGLGFEHFHPLGPHRCSDGWILIAAPSAEQFHQTCITCEAWELMVDDTLLPPAARADRAEEIDAALDPWLSTHTCVEAVAALQANRVPAGRLNDFTDVLAAEQLAVRHAWAERPDLAAAAKMPRAPVRLEPGPADRGGEAPHGVGADTAAFLVEAHQPGDRRPFPPIDLAELRVAEFSIAWAGPLTGRFLADLGAEVIKVEHPGSRGVGSEARTKLIGGPPGWHRGEPVPPQIRAEVFPDADPGERFWNRSGVWNKMNRGKRSLAMEAKTPEGKAILEQVLTDADIVLHNYSPRGATSLGVDAPAVAKLNPDAITIAMTGYGETGPMAAHFSFGPMLEAFCGLNEATGYIGEGPMRLGKAFPDIVGGVHGTFTTLCALWERAATGGPVHADLSQFETLASVVGDGLLWTSVVGRPPARRGNRSLDHAPQGVYRCAGDDAWLAVTVTDDDAWRGLVDLVGGGDGLHDATLDERFARHDELDALIEQLDLDTATRWSGRSAPGPRRSRLPGVQQPRSGGERAPRGTTVHGHVGPARRRPAALPRLPDPLRAADVRAGGRSGARGGQRGDLPPTRLRRRAHPLVVRGRRPRRQTAMVSERSELAAAERPPGSRTQTGFGARPRCRGRAERARRGRATAREPDADGVGARPRCRG